MKFKLINRIKGRVASWFRNLIPSLKYKHTMKLCVVGSSYLKPEHKQVLMDRLAKDENDLDARIILLCSYDITSKASELQERLQQIGWIVLNQPEHPIAGLPYLSIDEISHKEAFDEMAVLWKQQLERFPTNTDVLMNAAEFFRSADKEETERLILKALKLKPGNKDIRNKLYHFYSLWDGHEKQALAELERLRPNSYFNFSEHTDLPELAFKAGEFGKAEKAANDLIKRAENLKGTWNYGNAINQAHTVLGRIAVKSGDLQKACSHLEQSIIDIATPQTTSFGPALELAQDLLKSGQKDAVLKYLDSFDDLVGNGDNGFAFDLRFEAEQGRELNFCDREDREFYQDCFLLHRIRVIERLAETGRTRDLTEIAKWIEKKISRTRKNAEEAKENGKYELTELQNRDIVRYTQELERVKDLLSREESLGAQKQ